MMSRSYSDYRRRLTLPALRLIAGLAGLFVVIPHGAAAPASTPDEKAPLAADDGFTRESLLEFDAPPEPPPLPPAPAASMQESAATDGSHAVAHRHRLRHQQPAAEEAPRDVVIKSSHRRNPVESFVYWWNGWVIRNFHTRNGTVLLDTIGAKT